MFTDTEAFLILLLAVEGEELRRREHAAAVTRRLGLDPRLEPLVPLPPRGRRKREAYERVMTPLVQISRTDEPQRSRLIRQLCDALAHRCGRSMKTDSEGGRPE